MKFNRSRRDFTEQFVNISGLGLIAATFGPLLYQKAWDSYGTKEMELKTEKLILQMKLRYGADVIVDFNPERMKTIEQEDGVKINMREISSPYLRFKAVEGLKKMLALYPPQVISSALKEINIVDEVTADATFMNDGKSIEGVAYSGIHNGIAVEGASVLQDHFAVLGWYISGRTMHHELGHKIMEKVTEEEWVRLDPSDDKGYLGPFWKLFYSEGDEQPEKFATFYATANWAEDIASTAQALYWDSDALMKRCKADTVLRNKVQFVRRYYEHVSGGLMNEQYWKDVAKKKMDESYWDRSPVK